MLDNIYLESVPKSFPHLECCWHPHALVSPIILLRDGYRSNNLISPLVLMVSTSFSLANIFPKFCATNLTTLILMLRHCMRKQLDLPFLLLLNLESQWVMIERELINQCPSFLYTITTSFFSLCYFHTFV